MPFHDFTDPNNDPGQHNPTNPTAQPTSASTPHPSQHGLPSGAIMTPFPGAQQQTAPDEEPGTNLNDLHKDSDPALYRDDVIDQTLAILISKNKPNPLLVGPAGTGKTRIVEDIARRLANNDPSIPNQLVGHRILDVSIAELISGTGIVGQLEERILDLIKYATDPSNQVIIFIDEIHQIAGDQSSHGGSQAKVAQILKPHLARGDLRVIGATTTQEARDFDHDPALKRRFSRVNVDEFNRDQTLTILNAARDSYLQHFDNAVTVSDDVLSYVYTYSEQFNTNSVAQPDAALTLLDKALASLTMENQRLINTRIIPPTLKFPMSEEHVHTTARELAFGAQVPATISTDQTREKLTALFGQDHIIEPVLTALKREQLGIFPRTRPLSWVFAGSSGVGKTEMARILSHAINGGDPIIINGPEYISSESITGLIGSSDGYIGSNSKRTKPLDPLISNPHQVIVLDEFEKSHPNFRQLFMAALDTGSMTMANGTTLNFSQAIIIATTNAASDKIGRNSFGFDSGNAGVLGSAHAATDPRAQERLKKLLAKDFPVELLNRFQDVFAFNRIDAHTYREILVDLYARRRDAVLLSHPHYAAQIPTDIDASALDQLVETTFISDFGARPAARAIEDYIASLLI
ncbi:ATP-dependent Clp protease [Corynebacterium suranareeae]|uniref:ATP-dependent Clp protease n=1 Tax=Corynebacterium suranareeae TaxID=2506452 RepID=A0A160PPZ0_9CORY|nr:ATP-dependent Clp protease ATP-binding subunit [Corynebacterium suranareeae]BAU96117.1 ATP-dependent Clp protease [Corynebacterium suranareeae]